MSVLVRTRDRLQERLEVLKKQQDAAMEEGDMRKVGLLAARIMDLAITIAELNNSIEDIERERSVDRLISSALP